MLRYPHRVTVVMDTDTWNAIDETCRRLGVSKSHFLRFCVLPASVRFMDASDDFIPAHPPHAWSDEHVTRGETRCVSLTLSDEMMEVARRVASKARSSLPQVMRDQAALALDALRDDPSLRIPALKDLEASARDLLDALHAPAAPDRPTPPPPQSTQKA